jgi:hypothetical protein
LFPVVFVFLSVLSVSAQNKFEGYNIILDVPETHRAATCAIRYAPPSASITIADLDTKTPMNVKSCAGSSTNLTKSGASTATMRANGGDFKWCFEGEDKKYRISFTGDQYARTVIYDWVPTPDEKTLGMYNVKDWGAAGDGRTDDTLAVQSALAFLATRNGGELFFPEGDYQVGGTPDYKGLVLPSNVTIRGSGGIQSGAATNNIVKKNPTRITLNAARRALFRIGECTEKVTFKDIELNSVSQQETYGVEALGAYTSSQGFDFDNVAFSSFSRGIYAYGLTQTDLNWQVDYINVNRCRFIFNTDAGIYTNVRNSDWKIENSLFINPKRTATQKADSMHFERAAAVVIDNTFGGGFPTALGGTFLSILDSAGVLVTHSGTEAMTNSFIYNEVNNPYAGDYSAPITFLNSGFGNPVIFNARRTFVSMGNMYGGTTFKADERLRVYSTGDRFCYDGYILGCRGSAKTNFDKATVIFMTGQPTDGQVQGHPTFFGTAVQFGAPVQMPTLQQSALPAGQANGSLVYCSNCRRATTPCQAGGTGAPAMVVGNQWSCL